MRKYLAGIAVAFALTSFGIAAAALIAPEEAEATGKVTLCHLADNPAQSGLITVAKAAAYHGHYLQHSADVIPPFSYDGETYSLNWNGSFPEECGGEDPPDDPADVEAGVVFTDGNCEDAPFIDVLEVEGVFYTHGDEDMEIGDHEMPYLSSGVIVAHDEAQDDDVQLVGQTEFPFEFTFNPFAAGVCREEPTPPCENRVDCMPPPTGGGHTPPPPPPARTVELPDTL